MHGDSSGMGKTLFGTLTITAGLIAQVHPCAAAAWEGTDDFSTGISTVEWTLYPYNRGQMLAAGVNGHVSYIVPISTADEQNAFILWNGTPAVSEDWTADISGHNSASWSTNGSSQLQLGVANSADINRLYILTMARSGSGQGFVTGAYPPGSDPQEGVRRQRVLITTTDFGLRLVHRGGIPGHIEAWYDPHGSGLGWTLLDTIDVADFAPGMVASNTFLVGISANTYYGPVTEGELWADNFRITNRAIGTLEPQTSLAKAVTPIFSNLMVGSNYQLQVSSDLNTWTNQGPRFTATNFSMAYPQYWNVDQWGKFYFRVQVAP
jgi:hypothetical protein